MMFGRRYRVIEKIGSGGMADVYKAVDETLGRTVAVKVMHARYAADPTFAARFRQEAQAAANLQSPYIVNVYDWGQDGSTYYIVMEYLRGTDLKSLIEQRGALSSARVAEIGSQVCTALSVAHGYDIIHRDIKPHNIMVTGDGAIKVMDFGIARAGNTTMTQTGSVLGTAHYVSPEQAQGRPLAATSDLYSLGIVLYEAATGRLPFDAESPVAVALKQVNQAPQRPSEVNPDIDPGLEAIILKAMAKRAAERYATADEMRRDLLAVAQGQQPQATAVVPAVAPVGDDRTAVMAPVGGATPTAGAPPAKRHVWPWIILAVLLIAGGLIGAYSLGLIGEQGIAVPDVVGMQLEEAETELSGAGFTLGEVEAVFDKEVPEGQVMDQSPIANATAEANTPVNLTVSKGPKMAEVPKITGLTESNARAAIENAGLVPAPSPDEYSSETEAGIVFKQSPKAGKEIPEGDSVKYVVSRGKKTVSVPDVTGKSEASATSALEKAKFKVSTTPQYSEDVAKGKVISQNPAAGTVVVEGSTVALVVSQGSEMVEVPDVIGSTQTEAEQTLDSRGFSVTVTYEPHSENGTVIDQNPKAPATAKRGSTVTIVVDAVEP